MRLALTVIAGCVLIASLVFACGLEFEIPIFTYHKHPDFPRTRFLDGQLGVLEPTYARSYLYVAYRQLSGMGFNAGEREQVRLYWDDRGTGDWDGKRPSWLERWEQARVRIPGSGQSPITGKADGGLAYERDTYSWRLNCADDAFRTAIVTLQDRSARYGRSNPWVKDWATGQDAVFRNCTSEDDSIPAPMPANAPAWLKRDRAYQTAAAQLYTGKAREAEFGFRQISTDTASPWRWIAPYLVARVLVRDAESFEPQPKPSPEAEAAYQRAENEIQQILADRKLASIHGMTRALFRRMRARVRPQVEIRELARAVMQRGDEGSLRQDLWDYVMLLDHFLGDGVWDYRSPEEQKEFEKEAATLPRQDAVTDWIVTFQSEKQSDTEHAVQRWRKERTLPWLVAALSRVSALDPVVSELLQASTSVAKDSPAFWTTAYHRNRILLDLGDKVDAHAELESLFAGSPDIPKSANNRFRSLRMLAAPDLAGFLSFAQRMPLMITSQMNVGEQPYSSYDGGGTRVSLTLSRWDSDSTRVLNERTPLRFWRDALQNDHIPGHLRQEFAIATFARAALLEDNQAIRDLAPTVSAEFPEAQKYMSDVSRESAPEARHFAAIFFLLRYANIRPYLTSGVGWHVPSKERMDTWVNNWWCALDGRHELDWDSGWKVRESVAVLREDADIAASRAAFLVPGEALEGKREFAKMASAGTAPHYFGTQVLNWAREHPADSRVPEALALVVRVGRYGCTDAQSWKFGRDAHALLHSRYAMTPWARNTPYWYKTWYPPLQP